MCGFLFTYLRLSDTKIAGLFLISKSFLNYFLILKKS